MILTLSRSRATCCKPFVVKSGTGDKYSRPHSWRGTAWIASARSISLDWGEHNSLYHGFRHKSVVSGVQEKTTRTSCRRISGQSRPQGFVVCTSHPLISATPYEYKYYHTINMILLVPLLFCATRVHLGFALLLLARITMLGSTSLSAKPGVRPCSAAASRNLPSVFFFATNMAG